MAQRYKLTKDWQPPLTDIHGKVMMDNQGHPLRTAYLRGSRREEQRLREYLFKITENFRLMAKACGSWEELCKELNLPRGRLPVIANDPRGYTLYDIITDIEDQMTGLQRNGHHKDIPLSMVNRINWLFEHLSREWPDEPGTLSRCILIDDPTDVKNIFGQLFED